MTEFIIRPEPWHPGDDDITEKGNDNTFGDQGLFFSVEYMYGSDSQPPDSNPGPQDVTKAVPYPAHPGDNEIFG